MNTSAGNLNASGFFIDQVVRPSSFWLPHFDKDSAWIEHAPFAFWLTDVIRPRVFVELGTHGGYSYFSFCQAVAQLNTGTRCFAIDHWKGDEHSGLYGEEVYQSVADYNKRYSGFSTLIRSTFEDAAKQFKDGSVDLLHIDGRHLYEDVKNDFANWESKLSEHAVILFHDTNVRDRNFGVWKFFDELRTSRLSFEFMHGNGLGIVAWGNVIPAPLRTLLEASPAAVADCRAAYARLGSSLMDLNRLHYARIALARMGETCAGFESRTTELRNQIKNQADEIERLRSDMARLKDDASSAQLDLEKSRSAAATWQDAAAAAQIEVQKSAVEAKQLRAERDRLGHELRVAREHIQAVEQDRREHINRAEALSQEVDRTRKSLERIEQSRTWQWTRPMRRLVEYSGSLVRSLTLRRHLHPMAHALVSYNLVLRSGMFDRTYYCARYPNVASSRIPPLMHYLVYGWREGRSPHPLFDTEWYQQKNPDVRAAGIHSLVHYLRIGWREGRDPHPLFVSEYYLASYPDIAAAGMNPLVHFVLFGAWEGRNPNPLFDTNWYRKQYPEAASPEINPLVHYNTTGCCNDYNPGPLLNARVYQEQHPEISLLKTSPLAHALEMARLKMSRTRGRKSRAVLWSEAVTGNSVLGVTLRVVFIGGEPDTPGYLYRVIRYAEAATRAGAETLALRLDEANRHIDDIANADVVIIWRAAWCTHLETLVHAARSGGARVIFDVDDLMFEPELATEEIIDGIRSQGFRAEDVRVLFDLIRTTIAHSDLTTAPTRELAERLSRTGKPVWVLPNGYDAHTFKRSRLFVRRRAMQPADGLVRLGYAAGSRTHQKDFAVCAAAVAKILAEHPECRLVLFKSAWLGKPLIDIDEFPEIIEFQDRIEWREMVTLPDLPEEIARFDINLAPLEVGNIFCESKSELKYFEAALVHVCTVASPTGPFRRAIRDGETGCLAGDAGEWYDKLKTLVEQPEYRHRLAFTAFMHILWPYGPEARTERLLSLFDFVRGGRNAARAFALEQAQQIRQTVLPDIPSFETVFLHDRLCASDVTVIIPLHNYAKYVEEAMDSVYQQSLKDIDLIVIDDVSTDDSLSIALAWAEKHCERFNRLLILRNYQNSKLGPTRNVGFHAAETPYVLALDADNRLRPECTQTCLDVIHRTGAAFVYPVIQRFGNEERRMGDAAFDPLRLAGGNYIDALALVAKSAWVWAGGYDHVEYGWEDYDFWCRLTARGLNGHPVGGEPLADYRVHDQSMLHRQTNVDGNFQKLVNDMKRRHPWLNITS